MRKIFFSAACLFIAVALLSVACKDESVISPLVIKDTVYIPKDTVIKAFSIDKILFPPNPKVGDFLKITLKDKPVDLWANDLNISDLFTYIDTTINDTIISFWPLLPKRKYLMFKVGIANYNTYAFGSASKVITTDYETVVGIKVMKSDEPLIQRKNYFPTSLRSLNHKYTLTEKGDTVFIEINFRTSDESSEKMSWVFVNQKEGLPKLIRHIRKWNDNPTGANSTNYVDTLKSGIVKIEKWNENGVYCGIVYAELEPVENVRYMRPKTTFWVKKN